MAVLPRDPPAKPRLPAESSTALTQRYRLSWWQFRAARRRLGWTQAQLAARLGVKRLAIARWEAGLRKIDIRTSLALRYLLDKRFTPEP